MQCDLDQPKSISETQVDSVTWTRDGGTIIELYEGFEYEPESHTLDSTSSVLALSYNYFEQDPTGEQDDVLLLNKSLTELSPGQM